MRLNDAKIINTCFNTIDPQVGLKIHEQRPTVKLYMSDTGLLISSALDETNTRKNELYCAMLLDKLEINEGMFLENIFAQTLVSTNKKLYFYSRSDRENKENNMELTF